MSKRKAAAMLSLLAVIAAAALIFFFSSQEGQESSQLSGRVTRFVLSLIAPGFTELSAAEQLREIQRWGLMIRKLAHFLEYALLGGLLVNYLRFPQSSKRVRVLTLIAWAVAAVPWLQGLAVFDKRVMLFGSDGSAKSFSSDAPGAVAEAAGLPTAVVDCVDPIALYMRLSDSDCLLPTELEGRAIPDFIAAAFPEPLVLTDTARRWYATIGQFSIVRLERDSQLLVPIYDYGLPTKECPGSTEDDPCELFSRIRFPVEEFFPPDSVEENDDYRSLL